MPSHKCPHCEELMADKSERRAASLLFFHILHFHPDSSEAGAWRDAIELARANEIHKLILQMLGKPDTN